MIYRWATPYGSPAARRTFSRSPGAIRNRTSCSSRSISGRTVTISPFLFAQAGLPAQPLRKRGVGLPRPKGVDVRKCAVEIHVPDAHQKPPREEAREGGGARIGGHVGFTGAVHQGARPQRPKAALVRDDHASRPGRFAQDMGEVCEQVELHAGLSELGEHDVGENLVVLCTRGSVSVPQLCPEPKENNPSAPFA